eukprot:TRINITY_DN29502_c0_g1_i1.p2 TRINITY_DN29502_c0_g1~~TRINITY_DN29502_c0_g1_i1.p2  ORF type:complete len:173 (-),score=41.86 TRINITY_DN29502_c0_g1_i1:820-1293(-)
MTDLPALCQRLRRLRWLANDACEALGLKILYKNNKRRKLHLIGRRLRDDPDFIAALLGPAVRALTIGPLHNPGEPTATVAISMDSPIEADELRQRAKLPYPAGLTEPEREEVKEDEAAEGSTGKQNLLPKDGEADEDQDKDQFVVVRRSAVYRFRDR